MSKIYVARHGQDEDNANGILNGSRDTKLTEIGLHQAEVLAHAIRAFNLPIHKIYSSPLQRAFVTAQVVARELQLDVPEKIDMLREREYGVMTGQLIKDIPRLCAPHILQCDPITYFIVAEGAESWPDVKIRAATLLQYLKDRKHDENVLLVCHGDIGKMLYAAFYDLDWEAVLKQFHFGNSEIILLAEDTKPEDRHVHKVEQFNH